jgi:hypothetical protein
MHTILHRPRSRSGRWAAAMLAVSFGTLFLASVLTGLFGRRQSDTFDAVLHVTGPIIGVVFIGSGLAALVLAIRSLATGDRSILVIGALLVGAFAALFLLGELLFPH